MSVRLGAAATILLALAGVAVYLASWDQPNRPLMAWLAAGFALGATVLLLAPVEPLVQGRPGSAFWVAWSALSTAGIALFYWLDGGGRSPIAYGLVLALAFAGFLYPVPGAAAVAVLVVGGYLLAALTRPYEPTDVAFVATALACASVFCVCSRTGWRDRRSRRWAPPSGRRTRSAGSAATSSPCCCRARRRSSRAGSPTAPPSPSPSLRPPPAGSPRTRRTARPPTRSSAAPTPASTPLRQTVLECALDGRVERVEPIERQRLG